MNKNISPATDLKLHVHIIIINIIKLVIPTISITHMKGNQSYLIGNTYR